MYFPHSFPYNIVLVRRRPLGQGLPNLIYTIMNRLATVDTLHNAVQLNFYILCIL